MIKESIMRGAKQPNTLKLLHRYFEEKASKFPESVALIFEDENETERLTTYDELNNTSNRIANKLLEIVKSSRLDANKERDWIVCICMKPSDNLITAMLAIWKAGAAYLPIDVTFPSNRIVHIIDESKPLLVIYDGNYKHSENFKGIIAFKFEELKDTSGSLSSMNIADAETVTKGQFNMAIIIYTSGTTGLAKGVRLRYTAAQNRLEWQWKEFPFHDSETHCMFRSAVLFIDHFGEIWNPLLVGKTVVVVPDEATCDPEKIVTILEKYKIQRLISLPTLLREILTYIATPDDNEPQPKLSNLQLWINSGETLNLQLANDFFDYFTDGQHKLATFYGSTELMADAITYTIESKDQLKGLESIPIGKPTHNMAVYIFDENMKLLKEGEIGEIYVAGGNLADGYVNEPDPVLFMRNPQSLVPARARLFRTGDFGKMKDGLIFFEGRRDMQIKVRGYRVDINELENIINGLHFVEKMILQIFRRGEVDQSILAFVTLKRAYAFMSAIEIEADLNQKLPNYMIPEVNLLHQFPYLPSGKVDMKQLMTFHKRKSEMKQETIKVKMDFKDVHESNLKTAERVFQIIGESIGSTFRDKISVESNFFLIGGNSLNTIFCVNKLRKERFEISINDFIQAANIGEILEGIEGRHSVTTGGSIMSTEMNLHAEKLNHESKSMCIELLATSFVEKGDLDQYIAGLKLEHFTEYLEPNWEFLVERELSFMVKDDQDRVVGVSINYEIGDDLKEISSSSSPLETIFEYLGFVEHDIVSRQDEKILAGFLMGTAKSLNSAENIRVVTFMENQVLTVAKENEFKAVMTSNSNQLLQQIDGTLLGYKTLKEFQINRYVDKSGKRPFQDAEDYKKTMTMWKEIN